jgi:hypothetical protein
VSPEEDNQAERKRLGSKGIKNADAPIRSFVKFETPPLEINLLRKASSLLGNVYRASANSDTRGLRILWVESVLSLASVFLSSGFLGSFHSPRILPPPDGSSFYARDDFQVHAKATRVPNGHVVPRSSARSITC